MSDSASKIRLRLEYSYEGNSRIVYLVASKMIIVAAQGDLSKDNRSPTAQAAHIALKNHGAKLDRVDGPAYVTIGLSFRAEEWFRDDKRHRVDGPASVVFNGDGSKTEEWYSDGQLDRIDGPARVKVERDGTVTREEWYRYGEQVPAPSAPLPSIRGVTIISPAP